MAPELLRHSERPELAARFSEKLRRAHRPEEHTRQAPRATASSAQHAGCSSSLVNTLWEDDTCASTTKSSKRKRTEQEVPECNQVLCEEEENAFGALFDGF
jgi:hypothetical protein